MFHPIPFDGRPIGPDDGQAGSNPKVRFADYMSSGSFPDGGTSDQMASVRTVSAMAILRQLLLHRAWQNRSMARGRLSSMCRSSPQLLPPYPSLTTP